LGFETATWHVLATLSRPQKLQNLKVSSAAAFDGSQPRPWPSTSTMAHGRWPLACGCETGAASAAAAAGQVLPLQLQIFLGTFAATFPSLT